MILLFFTPYPSVRGTVTVGDGLVTSVTIGDGLVYDVTIGDSQ